MEIDMNRPQPMTIALLAASGVASLFLFTQAARAATDGGDTAPCRAASAQGAPTGAAGISGSSVRSFSRPGCAGAVLQGEHGTATVNGDRVELKAGTVYVNGVSYGSVTPAQTVEYDVARGKRTLRVDGDVRIPAQ
ncbi:sugar ABC transporter ATPase [Burkholderia anthina]|uniref:sugar ABC transporter ATPase n=1 Tax=Burkholderia anthina TaxID=179879 RepID=UPI0037BEAB6A